MEAVNSLDWGRPMVVAGPCLAFINGCVDGCFGMGGCTCQTMIWQLSFLFFAVPETDNMHLLVLMLTFQEISVLVAFAGLEWRTWLNIGNLGFCYAVIVACLSPVGSWFRDNLETGELMQVVAWLFLLFVTLRIPLPTGNVSTTLEHPVEVELASELHGVLGEVVSESSRDGQKVPAFNSQAVKWPLLASGMLSGFLGGMCGLMGPPFAVIVSIYDVPKQWARPFMPLGSCLEFPVRLLCFVHGHGGNIFTENLHIILMVIGMQFIGVLAGATVSGKISQNMFENGLLCIVAVTSLLILGVLRLTPQAVAAVFLVPTGVGVRHACLVSRTPYQELCSECRD